MISTRLSGTTLSSVTCPVKAANQEVHSSGGSGVCYRNGSGCNGAGGWLRQPNVLWSAVVGALTSALPLSSCEAATPVTFAGCRCQGGPHGVTGNVARSTYNEANWRNPPATGVEPWVWKLKSKPSNGRIAG